MDLWNSLVWRENSQITNNPNRRTGLYIRFDKEIAGEVREMFLDVAKWLRRHYLFPIRVPVYVKSSVRVKTLDGENCVGIFFEPYSFKDEPYIRIATGDYEELVMNQGALQAKIKLILPLFHELTHYYQWLNSLRMTSIGKERQASRYAHLVMEDYTEYLGVSDSLREPDEIEILAEHLKEGYPACLNEIERIKNSKDSWVRSRLAILLDDYINEHSTRILKELACDRNYLVQIEALDSLSGICEASVKDIILQCMNSAHPLVRGYAYRCLSEFDMDTSAIRQQLQMVKEKNTWARIELYISEARAGDPTRIQKLLKMYPKCNYLNRCAISNGIADIYPRLSHSDQGFINHFVDIHKTDDSGAAEKEAFMRLLKRCKSDVDSKN